MSKHIAWGDQGDGTYRNPVINADFPDVDIHRVGDVFYMISSNQSMVPGMTILKSRDLVNWEYDGYIYETLSWHSRYDWDQMDGYYYGVWAGDLAYHDGLWYCYQIDASYGLLVSTAEQVSGPWSEPILMKSKSDITDAPYCDDPSVFWDEDEHQAYLGLNSGLIDDDGNTEIRLYKMSWDGLSLTDEGRVIYTGRGAEALKIRRFNDRWYLMIAEWFKKEGTLKFKVGKDHDRKQCVLRSDDIYGPFEKKILLQRGHSIDRSCSQGSLVQAPDESWWFMHQLIQNCDDPFQGRVQMLEPVEWKNGWPLIGIDINDDGIGEPVHQYRKPVDGSPVLRLPTDDDFDSDRLEPQWEWNHNPRNSHWSLSERPGYLRIHASLPVDGGGFFRACNTLSQRIMGTGKGSARLKLQTTGMQKGHKAGFVRFSSIYNMIGILVGDDGTRRLFYGNHMGEELIGPMVDSQVIYLQSDNDGSDAFFSYSTDNAKFHRFGPEFKLAYGNWMGDRLGMFSYNDISDAGYADFDWFYYEYHDRESE